MFEQSDTLLILLIIANIVTLILVIIVKKNISSKVYNRILEIEKERDFESKVQIIKKKIDDAAEEELRKKVSASKEYFIQDAIRRSTSVTKGKVIEHFAPFMLSTIMNPDEMVFIGSPIDLISFSNIDTKEDISIDLLEIKTGNSSLNKKQKLIKEAIFSKRFFYKTVMLK